MKEDQPSRNNVIKKKSTGIRYENSADGCTIMPRPRMEEFASSMGQRSRNTPVMDAQNMLCSEKRSLHQDQASCKAQAQAMQQ